MTGIIDYGMGNLGSVKRKLDRIGEPSQIVSNPGQLTKCSHLILPGVGNFERAVYELKKRKLWDSLNYEVLEKRKKILGICLGMQLFSRHSDEGNEEGLGWLNAETVKFNLTDIRNKVPHIGWNTLEFKKESRLLSNITQDSEFYFVHSYYVNCNDSSDILAITYYGYEFVSAVQRDNIFGTQFHPEKSHLVGDILIRNFFEL